MDISKWIQVGRMDELARQDTPVHRLDARTKIIVTLTFIAIVMSFPRYELSALTLFLFYPVALIAVGRIPWRTVLGKLLVASPLALAVGIFNPLIDQEPLAAVGPVVITGGWVSFASILVRFVLTVSAAISLIACTGMYDLCAGLERLGVPRIFVTQLLFMYRYLFVVVDEGLTMVRAVSLRSAHGGALGFRVYGGLVGRLLVRSLDRAERVYRAMVARGFDGTFNMRHGNRFRAADAAFALGWVAFFATARVYNLADGLGRLLTEGIR